MENVCKVFISSNYYIITKLCQSLQPPLLKIRCSLLTNATQVAHVVTGRLPVQMLKLSNHPSTVISDNYMAGNLLLINIHMFVPVCELLKNVSFLISACKSEKTQQLVLSVAQLSGLPTIQIVRSNWNTQDNSSYGEN